jgi:hypothetical protein
MATPGNKMTSAPEQPKRCMQLRPGASRETKTAHRSPAPQKQNRFQVDLSERKNPSSGRVTKEYLGNEYTKVCERFFRMLKEAEPKIEFASFSVSGNEDGTKHAPRKSFFGGKEYEYRIDHDISRRGPTLPKISTRLMNNPKKLEKMRKAYQKACVQHKVREPVKLALEKRSRRLQAFGNLSTEDHQDGSKADPTLENCMLNAERLEEICAETGWVPVIDCAADPLGTNSVCVLYFDVFVDALQQVEAIKGKDLAMNPPFLMCKEFIELAERAFDADPRTRVILIVPKREGAKAKEWFKKLEASKNWRVAAKYPPKNRMFSVPDQLQPFNPALRIEY